MQAREAAPLATVRTGLLAVLMFGTAGTLAELMLLAHSEDAVQLIPVVLAAAGFVVAIWNAAIPGAASVRTLQILMLLFMMSGVAGVIFHYQANVEFQLELDPRLAGSALIWKVLQAKAPPALSPGLMVQLGLIGLLYSWKHPALARAF